MVARLSPRCDRSGREQARGRGGAHSALLPARVRRSHDKGRLAWKADVRMLSGTVAVRESSAIHGIWPVATRRIARGEWLWRAELDAARVPVRKVLSRPAERQGVFQAVGWQVDKDSFEVCGDPGRAMNHSWDPNTWWGGERTLAARREIAPDDELTYDCATSELALSPNILCACGSAWCRGWITNRATRSAPGSAGTPATSRRIWFAPFRCCQAGRVPGVGEPHWRRSRPSVRAGH